MKKIHIISIIVGVATIAVIAGAIVFFTRNVVALTFGSGTDYATGVGPRTIAIADFDEDGKNDFAVPMYTDNTVEIYLNQGVGIFGAATTVLATTGRGAQPLIHDDFNNDGHVDLAVGNRDDATIDIFLGNGDGTFAISSTESVGDDPLDLATGDFDSDGNKDLVSVDLSGQTISVLIGRGDGTFGGAATYATGSYPTSIKTADFDGDRVLDIVVSDSCAGCFVPYSAGGISVFIGRGDGTFGAATAYATARGAVDITMGDFNNDGNQDIVAAIRNNNVVQTLLGRGDGSFSSLGTYSSGGTQPMVIEGKDINEDGILDITVGNGSGNIIGSMTGIGDGSFDVPRARNIGAYPTDIKFSDFDGSGKDDMIISKHTSDIVTIYFESTAPTITNLSPSSASAGSGERIITVTGAGFLSNSTVRADGSNIPTTYINATTLNGTLSSTLTQSEKTMDITVYNPTAQSESSELQFSVTSASGTSGGGGGGGGTLSISLMPPTMPAEGFDLLLNDGALTTTDSKVSVKFIYTSPEQVEPIAKQYAISNSPEFPNSNLIPLDGVPTDGLVWNICDEGSECLGGDYTVYVKYYTEWGKTSDVISKTITYSPLTNTTLPTTTPTIVPTLEKPVLPTTTVLPTPPAPTTPKVSEIQKSKITFASDLRFGMWGDDVKKLQTTLNSLGFTVAEKGAGSSGKETNYFGYATLAAVKKFQTAYANDILTPNGISKATGNFGTNTRNKMNELLK